MPPFVTLIQAALAKTQTGLPVPQAYVQFTIEREFWNTLGWTYRDMRERPKKQVQDYIKIMQAIDNYNSQVISARNK